MANKKIQGKYRLSWNPQVDPILEERLMCINMTDSEYWDRMMKIIGISRSNPVTFKQRKIKWI